MKKIQYADMTKYPELFHGVYWGNFLHKEEYGLGPIYEARNKFAEDFHLKLVSPRGLREQWLWYSLLQGTDHTETYRTDSGGIVLVSSPYNHIHPTPHYGWFEYVKLYAPRAWSYVRVFPSVAEFKQQSKNLVAELVGEFPGDWKKSRCDRILARTRARLLRDLYGYRNDVHKIVKDYKW
jgi:hypothetical protein